MDELPPLDEDMETMGATADILSPEFIPESSNAFVILFFYFFLSMNLDVNTLDAF